MIPDEYILSGYLGKAAATPCPKCGHPVIRHYPGLIFEHCRSCGGRCRRKR